MIMLKVTFKLEFDYFLKKVVVNLFPLKKRDIGIYKSQQ